MQIKMKAVDTALEAAKDFVQAVITPPLEQVGGLLADQLKSWRLNNQITILQKAEALMKKRGITTKKVSLKIIAPFLEECSLEEDEDLQQKWAALLVNTVDEDSTVTTNIFTNTLKEMTGADAEIFQVIFDHCTLSNTDGVITLNGRAISPDALKEYPNISLIFDNLKRLRLIREISTHGSDKVPVVVTELGMLFFRACS